MRTGLHSNFPDIREKYREICKSRAFGVPHQRRYLDILALFGGFPREGNREFSDRKQGKQYRKQGTTVASRQGRTRFARLETGGGSRIRIQPSLGDGQPSGLRIERIRHGWIGADHAPERRVVDPAVEVNEAADAELLLSGEAARGVAGGGLTVGAVR